MKKVLMIANQFPPMGGSGVQRTAKFVKHLNGYGYEPIVLTRDVGRMSLKDESLLKDIPANTEIIRTPNMDMTELPSVFGLAGKVIGRKLMIPDAELLWMHRAKKTAVDIMKKNGIDLLYTTSYPYSDHLLGSYIKKKLPNVKWVADFRDEWTNNPYTKDNPHSAFRQNKEVKMESEVLRLADRLLTNTPVMMQNFIDIHKLKPMKCRNIPNGYDSDDFAGLEDSYVRNEKFTVTYTGALYGRRKPDSFFKAVGNLISNGKVDKNKIDIRLIGNYNQQKLNDSIAMYKLQGVVRIKPYMKHRECLNELVKSDALLFIEGSGTGANAFYSGKIFEYMNTKRPVIAVLPEGCAKELLLQSGIGLAADFDSVSEIENVFLHYYKQYLDNTLVFDPDYELIKSFEKKALAGKLAEIFDGLV